MSTYSRLANIWKICFRFWGPTCAGNACTDQLCITQVLGRRSFQENISKRPSFQMSTILKILFTLVAPYIINQKTSASLYQSSTARTLPFYSSQDDWKLFYIIFFTKKYFYRATILLPYPTNKRTLSLQKQREDEVSTWSPKASHCLNPTFSLSISWLIQPSMYCDVFPLCSITCGLQ